MEVGVEVWVKGRGENEGWFGGSVTAKVCFCWSCIVIIYKILVLKTPESLIVYVEEFGEELTFP